MKSAPRYRFHGARDPLALVVAHWVANRIPGCERGWDRCVAMEVTRGENIIGGVVYHDYNPEAGTICMSAAGSKGWLTRRVLHAMHSYVFCDAACQLAVLQVAEDNERMISIAERYGYRAHRIPRLRGRDKAEVILTLTDDDWFSSRFHRR